MMKTCDRIILSLAALAIAGGMSACSTFDFGGKVWYKPGGTIEERDRLLAAAEVQAAQAEATQTPGSPGVTQNRRQTEHHTVLTFMTAAGWTLVPKSQASSMEQSAAGEAPKPRTSTATALDR
jgi:hypothetical protein